MRVNMQIQLFPYERLILETLEEDYALNRELVVGFAISLKQLSRLFEEIALNGGNEFKAGRVVIMGLINHTHHLLVGGLQALEAGNGHVWSACARGLVETFGGCELISESPAKAPNFLDKGIPAGKLRNAAEKAHPGLGHDIDRLNKMVHPVSRAIYAGIHVVDPDARIIEFRSVSISQPWTKDGWR